MKDVRDLTNRWPRVVPALLLLIAVAGLLIWLLRGSGVELAMRVPGTDHSPDALAGGAANAVLAGKLTSGEGQPSDLPGAWPQFRGPMRDGLSTEDTPLLRSWQPSEPRQLWSIEVGEGYAGPAIFKGRVYLMDYDRENKKDALRCLSLADGREIWRFAYPVAVKRNHGMSRTVPTVTDKFVVAIGPKCHVVCLDPMTGELRWGMDMVRQFGTTVPPWYAGQCPLVDGDVLVLAPGGKQSLLVGVNPGNGSILWQSPNPKGWKMTHSSVVPMEVEGEKMYVYCADKGVVGVSARDGRILWETSDWKISIATVPTPVVLPGGKLLLTGGYKAGTMMLRVFKADGQFRTETLFRLPEEVFGATQQTPVIHNEFIYGVRPDGKFACLDLTGKTRWTSAQGQQFGLAPFFIANGLIFALNDTGLLRLIEVTPDKYNLLGQAQIFKGHDAWAPMAIGGGRLLARDLTKMVCVDVAKR